MRTGTRKELEKYILKFINESIEYNFLIFNYTHTFEEFLCPLGYLAIGAHDGTHRHWTDKDDEEQIINPNLKDNKDFLYNYIKPTANYMLGDLQDKEAKKVISESDMIFVFGMSLGESDKIWWHQIVEWLSTKEGHRQHFLIVFWFDSSLNINSPLDNIKCQEKLPIYETDEFVFYRCICFNDSFYGKTVSELHKGNLRQATPENRYSKLFPNEKISYWADSLQTARAEVKYHNHTNNLLTFWAYDDATSIFPTIDNDEPLIIIDGRESRFHHILEKIEEGKNLSNNEEKTVALIKKENPDCLAYTSLRNKCGVNFLFFEKGFKKLSIREVRLRLGDFKGRNSNRMVCAGTCDYRPFLKGYGEYFSPLVRVNMDNKYIECQEYKERLEVYKKSLKNIREFHDRSN